MKLLCFLPLPLPLLLLFFFFFTAPTRAEVFSSVADLSRLLDTEAELSRAARNYIAAQEENLIQLKKIVSEMARVHDEAAHSPESFLAHPINAYLLIKRLIEDWLGIQKRLMDNNAAQEMLTNLANSSLLWPEEEDFKGAAIALMRLQEIYNLDTEKLAQGEILRGQKAYRELTAIDCFYIGLWSYNVSNYYYTTLWLNEALARQEQEEETTVERTDILDSLTFSTYLNGNIHRAIRLNEDLLSLRPDHPGAQEAKEYFEEVLQQQSKKEKDYMPEIDSDQELYKTERDAYNRLCRGEGKLPKNITSKVSCYYQKGPNAFMWISPVKAEVVYIQPTIIIYHDVLSDSEIEIMKEVSSRTMRRARVADLNTGESQKVNYRITQATVMRLNASQIVPKIRQRIGDITGLSMSTAEAFQVANYGLGGNYEPHVDFAWIQGLPDEMPNSTNAAQNLEEEEVFYETDMDEDGNRIATFLMYLSDVEAGGATVFPGRELSIWPRKGSALFWYNLHPSGEADWLTEHGACPVLIGSKWISTLWIRNRGQEFTKPCELDFHAL